MTRLEMTFLGLYEKFAPFSKQIEKEIDFKHPGEDLVIL